MWSGVGYRCGFPNVNVVGECRAIRALFAAQEKGLTTSHPQIILLPMPNDRAVKLELHRPLSRIKGKKQPKHHSAGWEDIGPHLHLLAKATPLILRDIYEVCVSTGVAGVDATKVKVAPDDKAKSPEGIGYAASKQMIQDLREWGAAGKEGDTGRRRFADLDMPGGMRSALSKTAWTAYKNRKKTAPYLTAERILVRAQEIEVGRDDKGIVIDLGLFSQDHESYKDFGGTVRFAVRKSTGAHRGLIEEIAEGKRPHGSASLRYVKGKKRRKKDKTKGKWFLHLSYTPDEVEPKTADPNRAVAVHRGIGNALYVLGTDGKTYKMPGQKLLAQRRKLQARLKSKQRMAPEERGKGSRGHGKDRRTEILRLKTTIDDVTKTFCQQAAAWLVRLVVRGGYSMVIIEDYGGIEPNEDRTLRRVLDRFPLYGLKEAIKLALTKQGVSLIEGPSTYISSTCPVCENADEKQHTSTNNFRCKKCVGLVRPADYVAAFWLLKLGGADTGYVEKKLKMSIQLEETAKKKKLSL